MSSQTTSTILDKTVTKYDMEKVNLVFHTMSGFYGHLFTSQYKSADALKAAKLFWVKYLSSRSLEKIKIALHRMAKTHDKPPSLPEFLKLFHYTKEQALNAGLNIEPTIAITHERRRTKYPKGESPAGVLARKIKSSEPKELGEFKS